MSESVDLTNCDAEPIHIPGSIQPHGWMIVCDSAGNVIAASDNIRSLLAREPSSLIGQPFRELSDCFRDLMIENVSDTGEVHDLEVLGQHVTLSAHRAAGDYVIVEFELAETEPLAIERHLPVLRGLQRVRGVESTLRYVSDAVRAMIGYDRVMIYRFLPDLSGEVIAESAAETLPAYLGLRYPATDIPAQARRLYTLNLTRLIVDVRYEPVPLTPPVVKGGAPIDLSFAILRSVSPIHREYLRNMGVAASFSISIVIRGELWGLIACHHYSPRFISHDRRSFCELLAQQIATIVDAEERRTHVAVEAKAGRITNEVSKRIVTHEEPLATLMEVQAELLELVRAGGAGVALDGRVLLFGETPPREAFDALLTSLSTSSEEVIATHKSADAYPVLAPFARTAAGMLATRITGSVRDWFVWFRPEASSRVRWAGQPEKILQTGPNGPRLTPRGSFDEYVEVVKGQSDWWSQEDLAAANHLRTAMRDALFRRSMEAERLRDVILGTVSHDLRSPLTAISLAAQMLSDPSAADASLAATINASSQRMKRLLDNLMEVSRIRSGVGIRVTLSAVDLGEVAARIVDESRLATGGAIEFSSSGDLVTRIDEVRFEQVLANLLSNARHHGDPAMPIRVEVNGLAESIVLSVHNFGPVIPDAIRETMFDAWTSRDAGSVRGLGIGLFTVQHIVAAHGGTISVSSSEHDGTTFTVTVPRG